MIILKKIEGVVETSEFKFTLYKNDLILIKDVEKRSRTICFRFLSRNNKGKHQVQLKPMNKSDFEKGEKLIDIFGTVPNSTTQCVKGLNKSNISIFKVKTDVLGKKHIIKKEGDEPKTQILKYF